MKAPQVLVDAVQHNCDVADARHARDMTLCTYLLEMRELYRWEQEMPLTAMPPKDALGRWLTEREARWNQLEESTYQALPVEDGRLDPFEARAVNDRLLPQGLVYGAGYGRFHQPQFFLGTLVRRETRHGVEVLVAGREHARGISAPPAAFHGGAILVRQDALRRWLWEKVELWGMKKGGGPLAMALEAYDFEADPDGALERMTEAETETLILHELGEALADGILGPAWSTMLSGFQSRRAEVLARAVRDNLADCLSTLPVLLERDARASLHFYFAHREGLRRELFPSLTAAYRVWCESDATSELRAVADAGREHWTWVARRLLEMTPGDPAAAEAEVEGLLSGEPLTLAL
ncbi:MAG TPA: hypothetical protein VF859_00885 [Burkholderiales bacterium]